MQTGGKVTSKLYADKGTGTILSFTDLSGENYVEINEYAGRKEDYYSFKMNSIRNIRVENIRESKLKTLEKEKQKDDAELLLKRNIIPKLEPYQMAFVEFV